MGIHLKSTLRQPVRTLLLLLLIGLISFAFVARAVEYIVISREIERLGNYYRSIGSLEPIIPEAGPLAKAMALVAGSPHAAHTDPRRYVSGILPEGQLNADSFALTSDQYKGTARGLFISDIFVYGELLELSHSDSTGWWHLSLKVDDILEGRSENAALDEVLSLTIFPQTVPEGLDPVAGMEPGGRYFLRACVDRSFSYAKRPESGRIAHLRMKALDESGTLWFQPVAPGAKLDLDAPRLASMKSELAVLRQNLRTLQVIGTKDMTAMPQMQTSAQEYKLLEGRGIELDDHNTASPVCVISAGYAVHSGLAIGDTLKLTLRDNQGPYGYISTHSEGWQDWASLPEQEAEYEIVGIFDRQLLASSNNYYQPHEVYIPLSVLPEGFGIEGSSDIHSGSYSFVLDSTQNQLAFQTTLREPLAALGYEAFFLEHHGDNFWLTARPMMQSATFNASMFSLVLALTLVLCTFLYLRGRRRDFAIQRALGHSGRKAVPEMLAPMAGIGLIGVVGGGVAAWRYALAQIGETVSGLMGPEGVEATHQLSPLWLAGLCGGVLTLLLLLLLAGTAMAVRRPVLELLQNGAVRKVQAETLLAEATPALREAVAASVTPAAEAAPAIGGGQSIVGAVRYVLRHARRSWVRSSLCIVAALGFVLALGWISATLTNSLAEIDRLYDTTKIHAEFVPAVRGERSAMLVKTDICEEILATGIIEDYYFEGYFYYYGMAPIAVSGQAEAYPFDNTKLSYRSSPTYYVDDMEDFFARKYTQFDTPRTYLEGWDDSFLAKEYDTREFKYAPLLVNEAFLEDTGFALGDVVFFTTFTVPYSPSYLVTMADSFTCTGFQIIGAFEGDGGYANDGGFFLTPRACLSRLPAAHRVYSAAEFAINPLKNREIPAIREALKLDVPWTTAVYKISVRLEIFDEELRQAVVPLERNIELMEVLYPVTLVVSVLIGAGLALLLTLQSVREAAIMRVLGITKLWVRVQLTAEQLLLCIIGLVLGLVGLMILAGLAGANPWLCAALYLAGTAAGAAVAAVTVSNRAPLELLQVKE